MKNPFRNEPSAQDRDNPQEINVVERTADRVTGRSAEYDNPLVPNVIERPVERAVSDERTGVGDRVVVDRTGINKDRPRDPGIQGRPVDIGRGTAATDTATDAERHMDLFPNEELAGYRTQWESIQTGFVDHPRAAVEEADALVSQLVTRLTETFTRERSMLEGQWTKGDNVSTEDLRIALTRYRSFFHRLLSM